MSKLMRPAHVSRQRGIALIEVLIAMLVTAFGLAAISLLLVATMQYGKMAQFQNSAQQLAAGYAEQMRANPDGFTGGLYNKTSSYSASASAVKLTWAVMSFWPTRTSGSASLRCAWWHITVPMWRWGW